MIVTEEEAKTKLCPIATDSEGVMARCRTMHCMWFQEVKPETNPKKYRCGATTEPIFYIDQQRLQEL